METKWIGILYLTSNTTPSILLCYFVETSYFVFDIILKPIKIIILIKADNYQLPSKQMFLLFSVKPNMQTTLFLYITAKQWLTNWYLLIQCYITHKGIANIQRSLNLEMSSPILHYIDESISNALWYRTIIWSTETLIPFYSGESSNTICCRCPRRKHITSHTILMTF